MHWTGSRGACANEAENLLELLSSVRSRASETSRGMRAVGENRTTVDNKHLPAACRS
jgi:hypothetical protein